MEFALERPFDVSRRERRRTEIDGLRAVAIISVMAYHAFPGIFPGGFLGVDVFFVVSGYLISLSIFSDVEAEKFSLSHFYGRRVRRIFPPLIVVITVSIAVGSLVMLPSEFHSLGKHVLASSVFTSNILLWHESGYFDAASELKPLLHLWSLGVEEQFYVFWPSIVALLLPKRRRIAGAMLLIAVVSWLGCLMGDDDTMHFFWPQYRLWELLCGASVAYAQVFPACLSPRIIVCVGRVRPMSGSLANLGLIAIIASIFLLDRSSRHPGWTTLPAVAGAMLVIQARSSDAVSRRVLGRQLPSSIGAMSYSLYLWHWPLLSMAHIVLLGKVTVALRLGLIALAFVLSWLTRRFIEIPAQRPSPGRERDVIAACVIGTAIVGISGLMIYQSKLSNFDWQPVVRFQMAPSSNTREAPTSQGRELVDAISDADVSRAIMAADFQGPLGRERREAIRAPWCHMTKDWASFEKFKTQDPSCLTPKSTKRNVLVIGDSYAADLWVALSYAYPQVNFLQATGTGCYPVLASWKNADTQCPTMLSRVQQGLKGVDAVIFAGRWRDDYRGIASQAAEIKSQGIHVILFGPSVEFKPDVLDLVQRYGRADGLGSFVNRFRTLEQSSLDQEMKAFAKVHGLGYVSKMDVLCVGGYCPIFTPEKALYSYDYGHWTVSGAHRFGELLRQQLGDKFLFSLGE